MHRRSSTALVLAGATLMAGAMFAMATHAPPLPAATATVSSLPTDCPCAGECGMAEAARHRDE